MAPAVERCDVLVIGAGPAGLAAACYLARFRRSVIAVHDGRSLALRIPLSRNFPGFPCGVPGAELVGRMQAQAVRFGAEVRHDPIARVERADGAFVAHGERTYLARAVIFATGVVPNEPDLAPEARDLAVERGALRYCPVCDGYEVSGGKIGVLGASPHGAREALFLRGYSERVVLLARQAQALTDAQRAELGAAGVEVVEARVEALEPEDRGMRVRLAGGSELRLDTLYAALGSKPRSELVAQLGLATSDEGCVSTRARQALELPGLYAAGDVVEGLDQISVAVGQAAVAATQAHNHLRECEGLLLSS